ncbi:Ankyrin unc44 [Colletotrichum higginsianum IMI 349063]|uniref:Ankyrin unc44 n=1 Tax=Colletotrichum higginsianum (strain IMI 349063) TaxID=759273 RepID=A0A1B7YT01_COLHI|nr:Ankyrin unc44 [Colletotrichum higginsianum IMI 349063]OBR15157.1 Ankyrin unc44 [Colletotrichum higginsianum IMI 349063]
MLKLFQVFVGCPHRSLGLASLTNDLVTLFHTTRNYPSFGLLQAARVCASTVINANRLFLESSVPLRVEIASVFSLSSSNAERVFEEFTATLGLTCEVRIGLPGPHIKLLRDNTEDEVYKPLRKILGFSGQDGVSSSIWPVVERYEGLRFLLSTVAPERSLQVKPDEAASDGLLSMDEFVSWTRRSQASQTARYLSIPTDQSTSTIMNDFVRFVSDNSKHTVRSRFRLFTFQFRELKLHPDVDMGPRVNGTRLVLASFVAQALAYLLPRTEPALRPSELLASWKAASPELLTEYHLVRVFVTLNLLLWQIRVQAIWSIWDLEHCPGDGGPARLIQDLTGCFQFTDLKPPILFAGSGDTKLGLAEIMASVGVASLELRPRARHGSSPDFEKRVSAELTLLRALHPGHGPLPGPVHDLLTDLCTETSLREALLQWIARTAHTSVTRDQWLGRIRHALSEQGHIEPLSLQSAIMSSLSREENQMAQSVIRWVLHSRRKLSPNELVTALGLEHSLAIQPGQGAESAFHQEDMRDEDEDEALPLGFEPILDCLSGLVNVVDNEVHLSHWVCIDAFVNPGSETTDRRRNTDDAESHFLILRCLLLHFSSKARRRVPDQQLAGGSFQSSLFQHDFTAYALHFWPHHFKFAQSQPSMREKTESFLADFLAKETAAVAMMLQYLQSSRAEAVRTTVPDEEGNVAAVTLLASSGFGDIGEIAALVGSPGWESDAKTLFPALLGAVGGGHGELVRRLSISPLDDDAAKDVLSRAEAGELGSDAMLHMFHQAKLREGDFQLPAPFLIRAAYAGIEEIFNDEMVKASLDRPADGGSFWRDSLCRAVISRHFNIAELLAPVAIPGLSDDDKRDVFVAAAYRGGPTALLELMRLLSADDHVRYLWVLARTGNYQAVEELLLELFGDEAPSQYLTDDSIKSSVEIAVTMSSVEVVRAILRHVDVARDGEALLDALRLAVGVSASKDMCALFLATGVKIEDRQGEDYLNEAVRGDNMELAKLLVNHGAKVDAKSPQGQAPLLSAASNGSLAMVKFLVDEKADINIRTTEGGVTPLYAASLNNKPDVVEHLLSRGADVRIPTLTRNWSPLECSYDFPDVLRHLVTKASPPPDYRRLTEFGECEATALFLAARNDCVESVRLLLEHGDPDLEFAPAVDIGDNDPAAGFTALAMAARHSNTEVVRLLLAAGANVNHRIQWQGQSVLHCVWDDKTMAAVLEYGPDIESKDSNGITPLNWHASGDDVGLLRRLVNAGAAVKTTDEDGNTPLMNAVRGGCLENLKFLTSKGVPVHHDSGRFGYPVHVCCSFGRLEALRFLVERGADVNQWHGFHGTPLEAACTRTSEDQMAVIRYLIEEKGADVNAGGSHFVGILGQAFLSGTAELVTHLVDKGSKIDAVDRTGLPSLFNVCFREKGALELLDLAVGSHGAVVTLDARDRMARTILHCAAMAGHIDLVKRLVELEPALVQDRDGDGWTALHWAARRPRLVDDTPSRDAQQDDDSKAQVMRFLVEKGCPGLEETVSAGERTWTVLEIAKNHGAPDVVVDAVKQMMEERGTTADDSREALLTEHDGWSCDACRSRIWGPLYKCTGDSCYGNFGLCFKCMPYKDLVHDPTHILVEDGEREW